MSYLKLCQLHDEVAVLRSTASLLNWDQETLMPRKAVQDRAKQLSYFASKIHSLTTSAEYSALLGQAEQESTDDQITKANLREWRHQYERSTKLPSALVKKASETSSLAKPAWKEARQKGDFSIFAPHLVKLLDIAREKADRWGYEDELYSALLSGYERGTDTTAVAALFDSCRDDLIATAKAATLRSSQNPAREFTGIFPEDKQRQLNREVIESLGFCFDSGRIDSSTHPFCSGISAKDIRLTTRYSVDDFLPALFGSMHEAGHGLYEQGLNENEYGRPAGRAVSLGIHESQSLLWENHIGRSKSFWNHWLPRAKQLFPQLVDWSVQEILDHINQAKYSFIRVDADEATYDLHILLRFDLERKLLSGEIDVADIPSAWNHASEELFGITPASDSEGCLQDIHWAMGGIGYFATYSLGNFNASQLHHKAMQEESVANACATANYAPLLDWMRRNIHSMGSQLLPQQLMQQATGEATNPSYHLSHLKKRFL